jgi:hypothetical protein
MQDPKPENIAGQKRVVHRVEHRIDWGYVVAGVGLVAVAYVMYRLLVEGSESEEDDLPNTELYDG